MLSVHRIQAAAQTSLFSGNRTVPAGAPHSPSLPLAGNGKWISLLCSQNQALTPRLGSFSMQKSYQRPWGFAGESLTAVIWKGDQKAATREGLVSV